MKNDKTIIVYAVTSLIWIAALIYTFDHKHCFHKDHKRADSTNDVKVINYNGEIGYLIPVDRFHEFVQVEK